MIYRRPFYQLGTITRDGRVFFYTALGVFPSADAATKRCRERGALVFEQFHAHANGRDFGYSEPVPVASCVGE